MLLDQRCMEVTAELSAAESKIEDAADVAALRKTGMMHAWSVATHMVCLGTARTRCRRLLQIA